MIRRDALDRLYELLDIAAQHMGGERTLGDVDRRQIPSHGVYFFFEPGELRAGGVTPRVVRVGTHALRPSRSTLWKRLAQHRGATGGTFPGGGNHRGSIFRLHVGTAMLRTSEWPEEIQASWGHRSTAPAGVRAVEAPLEKAVSGYIRSLPFLWLEVDDPPGADSERGVIEAGAIALLSNLGRPPIDPPSSTWLGAHADRAAVRDSGLWNVNHVRDPSDGRFLDVLARRVAD